jgi:hypothetical protein
MSIVSDRLCSPRRLDLLTSIVKVEEPALAQTLGQDVR